MREIWPFVLGIIVSVTGTELQVLADAGGNQPDSEAAFQCSELLSRTELLQKRTDLSEEEGVFLTKSHRLLTDRCLGEGTGAETRARVARIAIGQPQYEERSKAIDLLESIRTDLAIESPSSVERIRLLETLTGLYGLESAFDLSAQAAQDALDLRRSIYGEHSAEAINGLTFIAYSQLFEAHLFAREKNLAAAQETAEAAVELARAHLAASDQATVGAWVALSEILRESGEGERAEKIFAVHVEPFVNEALDEVLEPVGQDRSR